MIRQLFSAATTAARSSCSISRATLQGQTIQPSTWLQAVRSRNQILLHQSKQRILTITSTIQKTPLNTFTRLFSTTPASRFTLTTQKSSSPFRLSSDKHAHEHSPSNDDAYYSPHKPKRQWPPDMSKLSPKHQFRLERKYRRRAALKYARPKFIKTVTLVQWGVIGFVVIYAVLFMNWDTKDTPFDGVSFDL
ncbi:hypothetical protein N7509_010590 [Penicillium cosmopolitanum]|uniref:Uncharacterized protein n=1 Tax=Penicillium cosmopolitanum TaxID=1131564 RepID=A0A9W9VRW9_9EURO|nr:uncharacterized protein N7509_010590 [Penicillium cosmopolitanum]KAJ5388049.1 hypothetical protein N7509_010590 [Penicillium cosmopolitanum]